MEQLDESRSEVKSLNNDITRLNVKLEEQMKQMEFEKDDYYKAEEKAQGLQQKYTKLLDDHNELKQHMLAQKSNWQDDLFEIKQRHSESQLEIKQKYQRVISRL